MGDTGPGGGIVFYVAPAEFASPGSDCGSACRYLESAPAVFPLVRRRWATPGNEGVLVGAMASGIGSGMTNTNAIQSQTGNIAASSAAVYAFEYVNGGKSDWHLPSKDELNELYSKDKIVGGFLGGTYWSSTEETRDRAWRQTFFYEGDYAGEQGLNPKSNSYPVRPVRAF